MVKKPECPKDMLLIGADCVFPGPPSRPENTRMEGNKCVSYMPPSCDEAAQWDGKRCVISGRGDCDEGIHQGKDCITGSQPECLMVPHLTDQDACLSGDGQCLTDGTPQCPPNAKFQEGLCVYGPPGCAAGQVFANGRCESVETPQFPEAFSWKGGRCVRVTEERCEPGFVLKDGQCISMPNLIAETCLSTAKPAPVVSLAALRELISKGRVAFPSSTRNARKASDSTAKDVVLCASGTVYDKSSQECVSIVKPKCPENQVFNGKYCAITTGECMDFQYCPTESYGKNCQLTVDGVVCNGRQEGQNSPIGQIPVNNWPINDGNFNQNTGQWREPLPNGQLNTGYQGPNYDGSWKEQVPVNNAQPTDGGFWRERDNSDNPYQNNAGAWREQPDGAAPNQTNGGGLWRERPAN
ncbi:uncharacterized protein N7477_001726 [Penicillium maclennaniae]|uniref:uncharacterized protein n=1 Tax=Penicillium maclennaniae TaxID=1343394 RepID=UPI0025402CC6|nr:uncharacterized protein N7477_001726 [Penicillium maclennaniae]KAJ5681786.1 hypothetical protein N7477_001726 [Penicillium maclennaniae]